MKKILLYAVIVIAVIAAVVVWARKPKVTEPPVIEVVSPDSSESQTEVPVEQSITDELQGIDLGDLEKEFEEIDKDLQSL